MRQPVVVHAAPRFPDSNYHRILEEEIGDFLISENKNIIRQLDIGDSAVIVTTAGRQEANKRWNC
tara:strand:+ start:24884 stop:25078 length:195 start_codon:yes stop_codon:yes gene_type:complete